MPDIATTTIVHGMEDGERIVVPEGEKIDDYDLPDDVVERLKEEGHISESGLSTDEADRVLAEKQALEDRIAELEKKLADAKDGKPAEEAEDPNKDKPKPPAQNTPSGVSGKPVDKK